MTGTGERLSDTRTHARMHTHTHTHAHTHGLEAGRFGVHRDLLYYPAFTCPGKQRMHLQTSRLERERSPLYTDSHQKHTITRLHSVLEMIT